jgi:hypothetical protein
MPRNAAKSKAANHHKWPTPARLRKTGEEDFRAIFNSLSSPCLVLTPDLSIVTARYLPRAYTPSGDGMN